MKRILMALVIAAGTSAWAQTKKTKTVTLPANPSYVGESSSYSYSSNYKFEADLNLSQGLVHTYKLGDSSYTDISIFGSLHYTLPQDHLQIGGEGGLLSYRDGSSSKTLVELLGVFTYNIDREFKNSVFGDVALGLAPAYDKTNGTYSSKFSFYFDVGKRFALWDHVAYKPLFRISKFGDQDIEFTILGLNVSLSF